MGKQVIMTIKNYFDGFLVDIKDLDNTLVFSTDKETAIVEVKKLFNAKLLELSKTHEIPSKYLQDFDFVEHNID